MPPLANSPLDYGKAALETIAEALWPTRCAVCDTPGAPLCPSCRRNLPYLDWWRSCPRCGAPYGRAQCTECNAVSLARPGRAHMPYAGCASAVLWEASTARIVRAYKDQGERRLAMDIAQLMAQVLPPAWMARQPMLVAVPATAQAVHRRGFDHMDETAQKIAALAGLPLARPFRRPRSRDQRGLNRQQRQGNMKRAFSVREGAAIAEQVLLVDDVLTTGATLCEASEALLAAGARQVRCLTFARVW